MTKAIELPCGRITLVSDEDWRRVSKLKWSMGGGYVRARFVKRAGGDGQFVKLHRFILSAPAELHVDHIDNDPLNNTRENLQLITASRNGMRKAIAQAGGVSFDAKQGRWRARVSVDGRKVSLGSFELEADARARVAEARQIIWNDPVLNPMGIQP